MLRETGQKSALDDTWGVGKLILICLEPGSYLKQCEDLQEDWNSDLIAFQKATKTKSATELLQVILSSPLAIGTIVFTKLTNISARLFEALTRSKMPYSIHSCSARDVIQGYSTLSMRIRLCAL